MGWIGWLAERGRNAISSRWNIEQKLDRIIQLEERQMAFAQDVLAKIASQTTIIASIKAWIEALPTDVISAEDRAAILANLDANSAELETVIPTNVPPPTG